MTQPSRIIDRSKRFIRAPFGSALLGGLVVGVLGLIAIGAGWIDSGDDDSTTLTAAPLTRPAADRDQGNDSLVNQIYNEDSPGVAFIQAETSGGQPSPLNPVPDQQGTATGSGFVIDDQGHILTNAHVVDGAQNIEVTLGEDQQPIDARVVGKDTSTDVAVLQVDPDEADLHPLSLGSSSGVKVGDPVVAIGNPFGLERTVTTGIVSALQRQIQAPNGFTISDVIQTDAAINPGNSGGPLLDENGQVIGITSQIATGGAGGGSVGVGFVVPSDTVRDVANQLLDTGEVEHAFLGISGTDVTPEIADALNLPVDEGALVQKVVPDSPADHAGIKAGENEVSVGGQQLLAGGDVITQVDGQTVTGMDDVIAAVNTKQAGDQVTLQVNRDGDTQDVTVDLGERPAQARNG
jgi:S1-C subfamily serine protease